MNDLPSLLNAAPGYATAVIIPETGTAVTYGSLMQAGDRQKTFREGDAGTINVLPQRLIDESSTA